MGANGTVSTPDAYPPVSWAGPWLSGAYRFNVNGDLLMGCNALAATTNEVTRVFNQIRNRAADERGK